MYSYDLSGFGLLAALLRSGSELRRAGSADHRGRSYIRADQREAHFSGRPASRLALLWPALIFKPAGCACDEGAAKTGGRIR